MRSELPSEIERIRGLRKYLGTSYESHELLRAPLAVSLNPDTP